MKIAQDSKPPDAPKFKVIGAVSGFMLCSASMLLVNKLAVNYMPLPAFLLLAQFGTASVAVRAAGALGFIEVDALEWAKVKVFILVAFCFVGLLFANMKVLQFCNVDTFIAFRASTPLLISIADYLFLDRELPSLRSVAALVGLLVGTVGYVLTDKNFVLKGYEWLGVWFIIFAADQLFIKHAVSSVALSNWGRVYYTNLLGMIPLLLLAFAFEVGELTTTASKLSWNLPATVWLLVSCVVGTAMSYFQLLTRYLVSATSFTVLGNLCKVLTIVVNCLIWNKHASTYGLLSLFVSLTAGAFYQQSPMRSQSVPEAVAAPGSPKVSAAARLRAAAKAREETVSMPAYAPYNRRTHALRPRLPSTGFHVSRYRNTQVVESRRCATPHDPHPHSCRGNLHAC